MKMKKIKPVHTPPRCYTYLVIIKITKKKWNYHNYEEDGGFRLGARSVGEKRKDAAKYSKGADFLYNYLSK